LFQRERDDGYIGNKPKRRCEGKRVGAILNNGPASSSCPSLIFIRHVYIHMGARIRVSNEDGAGQVILLGLCVLAIWQRHASMTVGAGERRRAEARESETAR
jgi:hypothetical protein